MKPYYADDLVTLYHDHALNVLASLPDASVDLIATDPPYFRVKDEPWDREWDEPESFLAWMGEICAHWQRVLKPNGSLYVFASPDMERRVARLVEERFHVLNVIRWEKEEGWHKKQSKEALLSFLSPWEAIVFAEQRGTLARAVREKREGAGLSRLEVDIACSPSHRGTGLCYRWEDGDCIPTADQFVQLARACADHRSLVDIEREYAAMRRPFNMTANVQSADLWRFGTVAPYPGKHVCEKPLALMEHIIRTSSRPGALVLDCFVGSGATLEAARRLGRKAVGCERSAHWCEWTKQRLSQGVLDLGGAA